MQDDVVINWLPNFAIELDVYLGSSSRLFNATKNDLGIGNINLETAKRLQEAYPATFQKRQMAYADLVQYIRSDDGTVHLATLAIKRGMELLDPYLGSFSAEKKEAVYITYYKQGPSYLEKFKRRRAADPSAVPRPGEGCRVCLQRERFKKVLAT